MPEDAEKAALGKVLSKGGRKGKKGLGGEEGGAPGKFVPC